MLVTAAYMKKNFFIMLTIYSPPKPHTFVSISLQSKLSFIPKWLGEYFTPNRVLGFNIAFISSWVIRLCYKQFDYMFIDSDFIFSLCSLTTILSGSLLKTYLENNLGEVSWSSVYYFITTTNKERFKIINSFLDIVLKSSKAGGEPMLTEIKSPIPKGSSVDTVTNLHMDSSSNFGGGGFNMAEYLQLRNTTARLLDKYCTTFKTICETHIDQASPISQEMLDTLVKDDLNYDLSKRSLQLMYRSMPEQDKIANPLSDADKFVGHAFKGLKSTSTIWSLVASQKRIDSVWEHLSTVYNIHDQDQLLSANKNNKFSEEDKNISKKLREMNSSHRKLRNLLLDMRKNENNLIESFAEKKNKNK